jgi:2-phospho-L-lactate guanylyltransferase
MILIPVKNLSNAKQRLASILDQPTRTELARSMLLDVVETVSRWTNRPETALVTSDPYALDLAQRFNFEVIADHSNRSETDAIEMATSVCVSRSLGFTLVIPGDIPLITPAELQQVFDAAPEQGCVLVPSDEGRGTNAILRQPANLIPLRFGNDSFKPHLAAARATGRPCAVLSLPGIALDIDTPSDLRKLVAAPGETRAQCLARQWDLSDLPIAANE